MQGGGKIDPSAAPLAGCIVVERSRTVAAAYAGRLLAAMGATVVMAEPAGGSPLRSAPPMVEGDISARFTYLAAGKRSLVCDLSAKEGRTAFEAQLQRAHILIDDTPVKDRAALGLDPDEIAQRFPSLVHVSVLPFGAAGPKADWDGEEINLIHASGEGYLLPNGLAHELFPDRPPLKIYGHFAGYQGGAAAALAALSAWWSAAASGGQYVDVSVQDAMVLVGAFALQRLGDGSLEHRATRRFRYGGVFKTRDAYVELLTLEPRQWEGLVQLLGAPAWATEEALADPLERSRRGDEINRHVRAWMAVRTADDIVALAQERGVPIAKYRTPEDVLNGEHEIARGLFASLDIAEGRQAKVLLAPFQFAKSPLRLSGGAPALGEMGAGP